MLGNRATRGPHRVYSMPDPVTPSHARQSRNARQCLIW